MATVADVLRVAKSQVGYTEKGGPDGKSGNITKYWDELNDGLQGEPWCGAFVSWVFKHAGAPLPKIDQSYGFVACRNAVAYAKKNGLWDNDGKYNPGDIIFFDWTGNGVADHTGIVVSDEGGVIKTIEGNTSDDDIGSQRNGGGVYDRDRKQDKTIMGVMRMSAKLSKAPAPTPAAPAKPKKVVKKPVLRQGSVNQRAVRELQHLLRKHGFMVRVDGVFGEKTDAAVKKFQEKHKLVEDGIVGRRTWEELL